MVWALLVGLEKLQKTSDFSALKLEWTYIFFWSHHRLEAFLKAAWHFIPGHFIPWLFYPQIYHPQFFHPRIFILALSSLHFHPRTFILTLSSLHFHLRTFILTLSSPHFHTYKYLNVNTVTNIHVLTIGTLEHSFKSINEGR